MYTSGLRWKNLRKGETRGVTLFFAIFYLL